MAKRGRATKTGSGRVTPKGGPVATGRYTPPIPKSAKVSPRWVPIVMFTCLLVGMTLIIINYTGSFWTTNNWVLIGGLGLITAGFVTATQYH